MWRLQWVFLANVVCTFAGAEKSHANPVRRVVTMLEHMATKVEEETKREAKLFDKYMCYCSDTGANLEKKVQEGKERQPQLETSIEETKALIAQLQGELTAHRNDRASAQTAIEEAKSMREQESKIFGKESSEQKANIAAVKKAVQKLQEGVGRTEFLQSDSATFLEGLLVEGSGLAKSPSGQELTSFLHEDAEAPMTNEIIGILKQMGDDMKADLDTMVKEEAAAQASFQSLKQAKQKEIAAATSAIETKQGRLGDAKVQLVDYQDDLDDTVEALAQNEKMLSELQKSCDSRKKEYDLLSKEQAAEKVAIAETIKILSNAEAEALFKKTLPGPAAAASFLQMRSTERRRGSRGQAAKVLEYNSVSFLETRQTSVAHSTQQPGNFKKILALFDSMLDLLKKDQADDDIKKDRCTKELDRETDHKEALEQDIKAKSADQANLQDQLTVLTEEITALKDDVQKLDKEVADATEIRKEENTNFKQLMAENNAAIEVLEMAKNRLAKFYKPKLYEATAAFTELVGSAADKDTTQQGEVGVKPQVEASKGVMEMIALIQEDIKKESAEEQRGENDAQDEYEELMRTSAKKRQTLSKSLTEKGGVHAETQENLKVLRDAKKEVKAELKATKALLANLHKDCDWFLQNAELRKTARSNEAEALMKAKAVMAGADYS